MRKLRIPLASLGLVAIVFLTVSTFSACVKTKVEKDILTVRDTTTVIDTVNTCSCNQTVTNGLVAYYTFTNGSLADSSGRRNNIVQNNGATLTADRFGNANCAYSFDGSTSFLRVADSVSLRFDTAVTLMAIFKANNYYMGYCPANNILSKGEPDYANGFYCLRVDATSGCGNSIDTSTERIDASYGSLNAPVKASTGDNSAYFSTGFWYNVIYTYGNGVAKLYVNGILVDTETGIATSGFNTQDLFIGKHGDPVYPYYLNGTIDEIRIYNRALCAAEVNTLNNLTR
jgi:hypothetical protein